ncbi:GNAT family N-acetyltransferase [Geodermatophilus sp. DSM 45219]|uniref:GNAT family N-acetyltransferase n=1 Tax=Geodermatophilus sp. DSM 45219 TaxID=1881103 RepID=UPI0008901957|nr:GNAT family N-acetyltransferase [Geodermatophilus sp. DSM 45219]SDO44033.1 Acetyltransferase (GNAT) family protein [Geodermatophilus sp. DSM 45219]
MNVPVVTEMWAAAGSQVVPEAESRAALEHGPGLLLVAEARGARVVGVVLGTFDGRRGWVHRLAVSPGHRRAGLATALVAELEERFRSLGAPRIDLLVLPDNAAGLASWQRLGHLPCPDVLCSEPLDDVAPTVSG